MPFYYISKLHGDNSWDGLAPTDEGGGHGPWGTLGKANNAIDFGDTVYIEAGTYTSAESPFTKSGDHIWITMSGSVAYPISYIGDPSGIIFPEVGPVRVDFAYLKDAYAYIENIDLFGSYQTPPPIIDYYGSIYAWSSVLDPDATYTYVIKCKVAERSYINNTNIYFENCFLGYKEEVIDTVLVINNNTQNQVVYLNLYHCTIFNATSSNFDINIQATDGVIVRSRNNIFINFNPYYVSSAHGIYKLLGTASFFYSNYNHYEYYEGNFIYNNGSIVKNLEQWQLISSSMDSHSSKGWANVLGYMKEPVGYRLNASSPCVDTGSPNVCDEDIEGNIRPYGSSSDKGCFEWQGASSSYSCIYYVRKTGNDSNDGLSPSTAFLTLGKATSVIKNYDTVYIGSGSYAEDLVVPESGSYTKWYGDRQGIHTGDKGEIKVESFYNSGKHHLWLENIHFYDEYVYAPTIRGGVVIYNSHGCEFRQLIIDKALWMYGAYCMRIVNCVAHSNSYMADPSYARYTINAITGCRSNWIFHNTFIHNSGSALMVGACANITGPYNFIVNNIFQKTNGPNEWILYKEIDHSNLPYDEYAYNFYYSSSTDIGNFYHDNIVSYQSFEEWRNATSQDSGSFEGDPLFLDDGYHLSGTLERTSPCIDTATATWKDFIINVFCDIDLQKRPLRFGYDIGADEVPPLTSPDIFRFDVSPRIGPGPIRIRKTPYREPQFKWPCTHYLSGVQYTLGTCPRCLGKEYFYDVRFDAGGLIPQVWDEVKLAQELEKITLTDFNPFHPDYGAKLQRRIGQVSQEELKTVVKSDILRSIFNLIKYQKAEAAKSTQNGYFSSHELIDRIDKVEIAELSATELSFAIYVVTIHGKKVELTGKILV